MSSGAADDGPPRSSLVHSFAGHLSRLSLCDYRPDRRWGRGQLPAAGAESVVDAALRTVMEVVIELLGGMALADSFLPVCRWWFNEAVCHPGSFRIPVEVWRIGACQQLDEQICRMREPPAITDFEDLRVGLEHAEEEMRLTELSASFPSGVTVVLLRFARRLSGLLRWINAAPFNGQSADEGNSDSESTLLRRRYLRSEAEEFRRRVALLADATRELRKRLPDPELPIRWAQWFEEAGEIAGFPEGHCMRYRSQREQVAAVWANNRRTFLSTDEHVDALVESLCVLDDLTEISDEAPRVRLESRRWPACQAGVCEAAWRRVRRLFGQPR
uniref:Uncharacterized protein n=1 Tax=Alexandrium catenella TaxID=2925 RepID=A0A7S1M3I6_ALECA